MRFSMRIGVNRELPPLDRRGFGCAYLVQYAGFVGFGFGFVFFDFFAICISFSSFEHQWRLNMMMITKAIRDQLTANFKANKTRPNRPHDFKPVLKLFVPWGSGTWLATELDNDGDTLFGLAFISENVGEPELGYFSLNELTSIVGPMGLKIERDLHFTADKTLSEYAAEARSKGRLVA
jgi:hypothetical protein